MKLLCKTICNIASFKTTVQSYVLTLNDNGVYHSFYGSNSNLSQPKKQTAIVQWCKIITWDF